MSTQLVVYFVYSAHLRELEKVDVAKSGPFYTRLGGAEVVALAAMVCYPAGLCYKMDLKRVDAVT